MLGIDTPNPEFLNGFESDLATALKTQFEALKNEKTLPKEWIKEQLSDKTWAGLFERIIAYM
jgi:hypothetical protein